VEEDREEEEKDEEGGGGGWSFVGGGRLEYRERKKVVEVAVNGRSRERNKVWNLGTIMINGDQN
jgi:hypothetical protein